MARRRRSATSAARRFTLTRGTMCLAGTAAPSGSTSSSSRLSLPASVAWTGTRPRRAGRSLGCCGLGSASVATGGVRDPSRGGDTAKAPSSQSRRRRWRERPSCWNEASGAARAARLEVRLVSGVLRVCARDRRHGRRRHGPAHGRRLVHWRARSRRLRRGAHHHSPLDRQPQTAKVGRYRSSRTIQAAAPPSRAAGHSCCVRGR